MTPRASWNSNNPQHEPYDIAIRKPCGIARRAPHVVKDDTPSLTGFVFWQLRIRAATIAFSKVWLGTVYIRLRP